MSYELGSVESVLGAVPVVGQAVGGLIGAISGLFGGGGTQPGPCRNLCSGAIQKFVARCHTKPGFVSPNTLQGLLEGRKISQFGPERDLEIFKNALSTCGGSYSTFDGTIEKIASKYGIDLSGLRRNTATPPPTVTTNGSVSTGGPTSGPIAPLGPFAGIDPKTLLIIGGVLVGSIILIQQFKR